MRIGIDLDETISESAKTCDVYALEYDKKYVNGKGMINPNAHDHNERFAWSKEQAADFSTKYYEKIISEFSPISNAKKVINLLKKNGHEIYIITYRSKMFLSDPYQITKEWLDKHEIEYDVLIANSGPKGIVCKDNMIDIFFDDSVDQCRDVINNGINAYLFESYHNKNNKDLPRVNNWLEIYKIIKEEYHG